MKKTLYLMRHGQTLFNLRKKIQGWCDSPLTELGIAQAQIAGEYFKNNNITFDFVYSSTSERASDTLEQITNMPYIRLKGLKEWNFGKFEGESEDLNPPLPYGDFFKGYGGEGEMEMRERISKTLEEIMSKDNHNTVLAISHGASCRGFMRYWAHKSSVEHKSKIGNCCIFKYEYENGEFTLIEVTNHNFDNIMK